MDPSAVMRKCLEDLDVPRARTFWGHVAPHLPQPDSDLDALATLHRARTEAQSIPLNMRVYSHHWLENRGLPSGLPDHLKPKAERVFPQIVAAVGVAVAARSPETEPLARLIQDAMNDAVREAHADGLLEDTPFVKARMAEARKRVTKFFWGT